MAIDFTKYIPGNQSTQVKKSTIDFSKYVPKGYVTPSITQPTTTKKVGSLSPSLGGGQFNVGKPMELVTSTRAYGGVEAPGQWREHIFPLALGGTSNIDNIKVYGKDLGEQKTKYEVDIINQYKQGKVTLPEARGLVLKKYRELTGLDPTQLQQTEPMAGTLLGKVADKAVGLKDKFLNVFSNTVESVKSIVKNPLNIKSKEEIKNSLWESTKQILSNDKEAVKNIIGAMNFKPIGFTNYSGIVSTGKPVEDIKQTLKTIKGIADIAFTPISGIFAVADQVPVVGTFAKLVTLPFSAGSDIGGVTFVKALDALPISKENKDILRNEVKEIGSLAGMLIVGGKLVEGGKEILAKKKPELVKKYGETEANTIIEKAQEKARATVEPKVEPVVPNKIDFTKYIEKPTEQISKLEIPRLQEELKSAVINIPERGVYAKLTDLTPEQFKIIKNEVQSIPFVAGDIVHLSQLDKVVGKQKEITLEDIKGLSPNAKVALDNVQAVPNPELMPSAKVSGVAKNIEAKAIEQGMINKGVTELPEYDASTIKKQSELGSQYSISQLEEISKTGNLPEGMKPATPLSILEDFYKNEPVKLIELAKSPLTSRISESASEVSLSRMREKGGTVEIIKDIINARKEKVKEQIKSETSKIKEEIRKSKPTKDAWLSFVESIKC